MGRPDRKPEAKNIMVPVYLPTEAGVTTGIELGKANLKAGTLVIEFNDKLPAMAIQRLLERGQLLGVSFVMVDPEKEPTPEESVSE